LIEVEKGATAIPSSKVSGLKHDALPFLETIAQSFANIAPTATPALTIPLVFASAGKGTWLTYLFATIGLVLVGICINQFARRSATPGSLYAYTTQGLGKTVGFVSGWGLILAYLATGIAVVFGFAIFASDLLSKIGIQLPVYVLYLAAVVVLWFFAYRDIQLSAKLMLSLELISVSIILILAIIVLSNKGLSVDTSQLSLEGVSFDGLRLGLVLAVFSYVGFESATALGAEARKPLTNIPRAVIISTVMVGLFFVIMSYVEVTGFDGYKSPLNESSSPLVTLAEMRGVDVFGVLTSAGAMVSFFACALACVNAVSRILFSMGRDGIIHTSMGRAHTTNETPHIAATLSAICLLVVPTLFSLFGVALLDAYGYTGTIATFGFIVAYILIAIAAPLHLRRLKVLRPWQVVVAVLAVLFMCVPLIGSIYPAPAWPYNLLPYLFLGCMAVGLVWVIWSSRRSKSSSEPEKAKV
jgi:amino acid transporter